MPEVIPNALAFIFYMRLFDSEKCRTKLYEQKKEHLPDLIKKPRDLPLVFQHLNEEQKAEIYKKRKLDFNDFAYEVYESLFSYPRGRADFLSILNNELRAEVVKKFNMKIVGEF